MIHVESAKTRSALTSLSSRAPSLMDVFCVPFERVMTAARGRLWCLGRNVKR